MTNFEVWGTLEAHPFERACQKEACGPICHPDNPHLFCHSNRVTAAAVSCTGWLPPGGCLLTLRESSGHSQSQLEIGCTWQGMKASQHGLPGVLVAHHSVALRFEHSENVNCRVGAPPVKALKW